MSNRPALVSQAEIKRTLQAALSAGLRIGRLEVDHSSGRVVVFPDSQESQVVGPNPDELLK